MNQRTRNMLRLLVCMVSAIIVFPRQVHAEILVFAIEAVIYCTFLKRVSEKKDNSDYTLYAFVANGISFVIGLYLASHLPGIF